MNREDKFQELKSRATAGYLSIAERLDALANEIRNDLEEEGEEEEEEDTGGDSKTGVTKSRRGLARIIDEYPFIKASNTDSSIRDIMRDCRHILETCEKSIQLDGRDQAQLLGTVGALLAIAIDRVLDKS
jgi:hypothetical protein